MPSVWKKRGPAVSFSARVMEQFRHWYGDAPSGGYPGQWSRHVTREDENILAIPIPSRMVKNLKRLVVS